MSQQNCVPLAGLLALCRLCGGVEDDDGGDGVPTTLSFVLSISLPGQEDKAPTYRLTHIILHSWIICGYGWVCGRGAIMMIDTGHIATSLGPQALYKTT